MQIRPHSAVQSHQHSRINSNQQFGYFYMLNQQGKQIKVNKQGELIPKFVDNFTGFVNFKQRKNQSLKDKSLMYSQPNLKYNKQENLIHPKGKKFLGYAQFPYHLKGNMPQFLQEETFKQSCQARNVRNPLKKTIQPNNIRYSEIFQCKNIKQERKERKVKTFKSQCDSFVSFDQLTQKKQYQSNRLSQSSIKKKSPVQKSMIMDASAKYCTMQKIKSENCKSLSTFYSTNVSNQLMRGIHPNKQLSYFSQSLFNIEKTQTPNFVYENTPQQMASSMSSDSSAAYPFNQTSLKSKCYKSSCQYQQYIPKRRYKKQQPENNTVCINEYQNQLQLQKKESQIVLKLKDSLKIYQPVPIQKPTINDQQKDKKGTKDKLKPSASQGTTKLKK